MHLRETPPLSPRLFAVVLAQWEKAKARHFVRAQTLPGLRAQTLPGRCGVALSGAEGA
jgi:hypothetical protein